MNLVISYIKNKPQRDFHEDIVTRHLHLSAGYGTGKTYGLVMKLFQLSLLNKDIPGGLMCPSYTDFMKDINPMIEEVCYINKIKYKYNQMHHWYRFPWSRGKVYVVSGEKKTRGPNWGFGVINEVTLIPYPRYRDFVSRVRVRKATCPQIASCGTPEGVISEYYDFFVEKPGDKTKVIYGSTYDNLDNLDSEYIDSLKGAFDQKSLESYIHGQFVNLNGKQFYYAYNPKINENKSLEYDDNKPVHCFMDFNVSPFVATIWQQQFLNNKTRLVGVDEIVIPDGADTKQMADALKARGYYPENTIIYPDPAGKARSTKGTPDIEILEREGFYNIKVKKKAPLIRTRQLNVCNLLEKGMIVINPLKMPTMRKDLLLVEQDVVTLEKVKKNQELTHASDGLDYGCDIIYPFSGVKPNSSGIYKVR